MVSSTAEDQSKVSDNVPVSTEWVRGVRCVVEVVRDVEAVSC
jgi:hypothetical protein